MRILLLTMEYVPENSFLFCSIATIYTIVFLNQSPYSGYAEIQNLTFHQCGSN